MNVRTNNALQPIVPPYANSDDWWNYVNHLIDSPELIAKYKIQFNSCTAWLYSEDRSVDIIDVHVCGSRNPGQTAHVSLHMQLMCYPFWLIDTNIIYAIFSYGRRNSVHKTCTTSIVSSACVAIRLLYNHALDP